MKKQHTTSYRILVFLLIMFFFNIGCEQKEPPNILVIMSDDHCKAAISSYGSEIIQTPSIDRLAKEGMIFHNMMVSNSLCAPSRAILLTGKHSHNNGMMINRDLFNGQQQTFPKLLQEVGYETGIIGKWHLKTRPEGFDFYSLMDGQGQYYDCPLKESDQEWDSPGKPHKGYLTDVITDKSIEWLEKRKKKKPFCLLVHHKAPHGPHDPAPRHADLFENQYISEPATLYDDYEGKAPEPIEDKLSSSRMAICRYPQYREEIQKYAGNKKKSTQYIYQVYMKGYLRLVKSLDENVGRLLDYLDESALARNTLVIYISDNGFFTGEHGFFNKMWMYEPSMNLPLIMRLPGMIEAETRSENLLSLPDLTATLLEISGNTPPADIQGKSFYDILKGRTKTVINEAVYYHYYEAYNVPEQIGIRTETHKLIYFPTMPEDYKWELYDIQKDPAGIQNLYHHESSLEKQKHMKRMLKEKIKELKDTTAIKFNLSTNL